MRDRCSTLPWTRFLNSSLSPDNTQGQRRLRLSSPHPSTPIAKRKNNAVHGPRGGLPHSERWGPCWQWPCGQRKLCRTCAVRGCPSCTGWTDGLPPSQSLALDGFLGNCHWHTGKGGASFFLGACASWRESWRRLRIPLPHWKQSSRNPRLFV